jgi:hypothetical protein
MLARLTRQLRQVAADPVLRRHLTGRLLGRWPSLPRPAHTPVPGLAFPQACIPTRLDWPALPEGAGGADLPLAGTALAASPALFECTFDDGETLSALHRFAWIPLLGDGVRFGDVQALWQAWRARFATPDDSPVWEAYTAAERAINLLDLGRRAGLPAPVADTVAVLAAHAAGIAERLEYFGEHGTHNHLCNNARGLYRLGCDLGMDAWAEVGAALLRREIARIFLASGCLREGSSHYHLLYVRNIADCWLAARRAGRDAEAAEWQAVLERMLAVVPHLALPGGLPLVGDISPDSPPGFLAGLLPGGDAAQGWTGLLPAEERAALVALRDATVPVDKAVLAADGWLRADMGAWSGLWYAAPEGWSFSPGHGHQDTGSAEIHFAGVPLFVDAGRGGYGESGDAALFRSAAVHNGIQVDGADPYPVNKPYYAPQFRRAIGGEPPRLAATPDGVALSFDGFARLRGVGRVTRAWQFAGNRLVLVDEVAGSGRHRLTRRLVTPHPARMEGGRVLIDLPGHVAAVTGEGLSVREDKRWLAYGTAAPAWVIEADGPQSLPWRGSLTIEVL